MRFLLLFFILVYNGCTIQRKIYAPTKVNNPSLQAAKDYDISVAFSTPPGFDLNSGYAITNNFAVIAGFYHYKNSDREKNENIFSSRRDSSILVYKHNGFHAGAGYIIPLSQDKRSSILSFFGGYSKGKFEMQETLYKVSSATPALPKLNYFKSDLNRWFVQGSINIYEKYIHQSFVTRFNYAGYNNVITDYSANEQHAYLLPPTGYPKWSSFLDFSFDTKIFFDDNQRFGFQIFGITTTRLNRKDFNFYYYPFRFGLGLVLKTPFKKTT